MKRLPAVILSMFLLSGCIAQTSFEAEMGYPSELFGYGYDYLNGRVYYATCKGNIFESENALQKDCLKHIAEFTKNNGYRYFSIIYSCNRSKRFDLKHRLKNSDFLNTRKYRKDLTLILADESILSALPNYYRADDYLNRY